MMRFSAVFSNNGFLGIPLAMAVFGTGSTVLLVVFPVVITALLFAVKGISGYIDGNIIVGTFIAFAMPTAGLASTFSDQFNGDTDNAVAFTLGSTLLSIATIPGLYALLCFLI